MTSPIKIMTASTLSGKAFKTGAGEVILGLCERFERRLAMLKEQRTLLDHRLAEGHVDFREETIHIRKGEWTVDPVPDQLLERRVEMLGGGTRSEIVNGMNAGARTFVADLTNLTPSGTWSVLRAHRALERAAKLDLAYLAPDGGRIRINPRTITRLMVVPRPLFASEHGMQWREAPVSAGIFDMVLLMLNGGRDMVEKWGGVYVMLRDVRTHLEARLWAQLFEALEEHMEMERGTIRATVMIDSIPAALEADEILFELMHHAAGLTMDPQGYAADHIALFHKKEGAVMPDRETIGLNSPFLRSLAHHIIGICHRRNCHAIGSPSFVLPPLDPTRMKAAYLDMLADKEREAVDGFDGTMVVHPDTVNPAMAEFNKSMPRANQIYYKRNDDIAPPDLVRRPEGQITVESLTGLVRTALRALVQLQEGRGWVVQGGRMHDRSSLRLAVRLLWHWNHATKGIITASGLDVHDDLLRYLVKKEGDKMFTGADERLRQLAERMSTYLVDLVLGEELPRDPII
jgi:malate synthase